MKIGVDGGGTKTELILVGDDGEILARQLATGCNPSVVGAEAAREVLDIALRTLVVVQPIGAVTHTLLCMAGSPEFWRQEEIMTRASTRSVALGAVLAILMPVMADAPLHASPHSQLPRRLSRHKPKPSRRSRTRTLSPV